MPDCDALTSQLEGLDVPLKKIITSEVLGSDQQHSFILWYIINKKICYKSVKKSEKSETFYLQSHSKSSQFGQTFLTGKV